LNRALLLVTLSLLLHCKGASSRRLAYGSADDVDAILKSGGVSGKKLACANPTTGGAVTRGVTCTTTLSAAEVTTLTAKLALKAGSPVLMNADHDTCETTPGLESANPNVDVLLGTNVAVTNGVGRFEIHVDRTSRVACVQIQYPWG
jgi:hypothetical protein